MSIINVAALCFALVLNMWMIGLLVVSGNLYHTLIGTLASFNSVFYAVFALTEQERKNQIVAWIAVFVSIMMAIFFFNYPALVIKITIFMTGK
ncbi:MAG: hypothetical protein HYW78_01355 [Parcubacteria group bacterium]|nr:hypothetical protein [Parcubacteria group bacterium]